MERTDEVRVVIDSEVASVILRRMDAVADLIEMGKFGDARSALSGQSWCSGLDLRTVPADLLRQTQQWIDTGYSALSGGEPDLMLARNILLQIRRIILG